LNNAPNVYFRLYDDSTTAAGGGTVTTAGTDRVDNFSVTVVPEASTFALAGLGGAVLLIFGRRKDG
jgi:hypothetical protein